MNEELKREAERRELIGETLTWATEFHPRAGALADQLGEWMEWALDRLSQPWGKTPA